MLVPLALPPVVATQAFRDADRLDEALRNSVFTAEAGETEGPLPPLPGEALEVLGSRLPAAPASAGAARFAEEHVSDVEAPPDDSLPPLSDSLAPALTGLAPMGSFGPRAAETARRSPSSRAEPSSSGSGSGLSSFGGSRAEGPTSSRGPERVAFGSTEPTAAAVQASQDSLSTSRNTAIVFSVADLLDNDSPAGALALDAIDSASVASPPGTIVQISASQYRYTPGLNFAGTDQFTYRVSSGGQAATGSVAVTVSPKTPPAVAETRSGVGANTGSVATSASLTGVPGHLYVAFVSHHDDAITVTGLTGLGLSWTFIDRQCSTQGNQSVEAWYAAGAGAVSGAVTASLSSVSSSSQIAVARVSGAATSAIGAVSKANANGASGGCGPGPASKFPAADINLAFADSRVLSGVSFSLAPNSHTPGSATELLEAGSGANPDATSLAVQTLSSASTGPLALPSELGAAGRWATISVEIPTQ